MLIKLNDKEPRPDDFFLYAQCNSTLVMYGFSMDPEFASKEVAEINHVPQKCLPASFGEYLTISQITSVLESMRPVALSELNEEIEKLRRHITNDRFPYLAPNGTKYFVLCSEGEHRDLIKGARRKAERTPGYQNMWIMLDADDNPQFIPMVAENFVDLANSWEDWGGLVFERSVQMKMELVSLRYEQLKNYDVDFTMLTTL